MKPISLLILTAVGALAQAPSPVQRGVQPVNVGPEPIFRVEVTSRTARAVNYHTRQGTTKIDFRGTALLPTARGEATVTANTGATRISLSFDRLSNPAQFGPEYLTYVLWGITPEGRAERLGEVTLKDANSRKAELYATTDLQSFGMIVTAEPYFSVSQPSDVVVMENFLRGDTTGTMEYINAKYELLKRGDYTLNVGKDRLTPLTSDLATPLQLREAREAMAIARAQGADRYASDTMQKAAVDLRNAEGFLVSRNWKELDTTAREATQMAEDARRITIAKQREEAEQAQAQREADAQMRARQEAERRAQAESDAAQARRMKEEADQATARARSAEQQADAARQAAVMEQQRLAQAKVSADSAREQAEADRARAEAERARAEAERAHTEQDAQKLREQLREQLNAILLTRDTARGLIVSMSDVLFDFNEATLKPGAREKLAKISGIVLAHPSLRLALEGYTDSIGSDDYNQKLSEKRAGSVRDYLVTNGVDQSHVTATGFGKQNPVASNDNAAGRQQNRRVEMVVSGDVIGQPMDPTASRNK